MGVATENFIATEFNAPDVPWWNDIITGFDGNDIKNGFIRVSEKPGLGFDDINDEVIKDHLTPGFPDMWAPTDKWNTEYSNDRLFSLDIKYYKKSSDRGTLYLLPLPFLIPISSCARLIVS